MAILPNFLRGRHLTAVTITPCTVGSDGTITTGTAGSLSGFINSIRLSEAPAMEMIQSIDRTVGNHELLYDDGTIELEEILAVKSSARTNVLPAMAYGYDVFLASYTRGGQSWSMYGKRGPYNEGVDGFGKQVARLTIFYVDIGGTSGSPISATL